MADQELEAPKKQEVATGVGEFTREGIYFSPAVDIYDTARELVILADMPGIKADSVEVDLKDDTLTIMGKNEPTEQTGQSLLEEYRIGNYYRAFRITNVVDRSKISAAMADGVLRLTLPKVSEAVPRKIPITSV
jgi:HSP20 family protein